MAAVISVPVRPVVISRWRVLLLAVAVLILWLVAFEGGSVSELVGRSSQFLHESFHDGRHLLGVPCH